MTRANEYRISSRGLGRLALFQLASQRQNEGATAPRDTKNPAIIVKESVRPVGLWGTCPEMPKPRPVIPVDLASLA